MSLPRWDSTCTRQADLSGSVDGSGGRSSHEERVLGALPRPPAGGGAVVMQAQDGWLPIIRLPIIRLSGYMCNSFFPPHALTTISGCAAGLAELVQGPFQPSQDTLQQAAPLLVAMPTEQDKHTASFLEGTREQMKARS